MKYLIPLLFILNATVALSIEQEPPKERPGDRCEPYPECSIWPEQFSKKATIGKYLDIMECAREGKIYTEMTTSYGTKLGACMVTDVILNFDMFVNGDENHNETWANICAKYGGIWVWLPKNKLGNRVGYCWFP